MRKSTLHKSIIFGLIAIVFLFIVLTGFNNQILTKHQPIKTNILVIEGWLPASDLELVTKEIDLSAYQVIFVTGISHPHPEYLKDNTEDELRGIPGNFYSNGCLCLSRIAIDRLKTTDSISEIKIIASGKKAFGRFPNIFLAINDSIIGSTFVTKQPASYLFKTKFRPSGIKGIYLYFNNCLAFGKDYRNLRIDSFSVNGLDLNQTSDFCRINDDQINDNLYTNYPFRSNAQLTTDYLKLLGIKTNIITLDTFFNDRNKTLAAAEKLEAYLQIHYKDERSINVVSIHGHSRRSYLAYKIASRDKRKVGIISLNDTRFQNKENVIIWLLHIMNEYLKLFITSLEYLFICF